MIATTMPRQCPFLHWIFLLAMSTTVMLMGLVSIVPTHFSTLSLPPLSTAFLFPVTENDITADRIFVKGAGNPSPEYLLEENTQVIFLWEEGSRMMQSEEETVLDFLQGIRRPFPDNALVVFDTTTTPYTVQFLQNGTIEDTLQEMIIPAPIRTPDYTMAKGEEVVTVAGVSGVHEQEYHYTVKNGRIETSTLLSEHSTSATPAEITYGTLVSAVSASDSLKQVISQEDGSGYLIFASGDSLHFSEVLSCNASAYTTGHDGVGTRTATGNTIDNETIAVDSSVIPLGSHLFVSSANGKKSYGMRHAEDTGPAIRGNKVDLFLPTYTDCIQFGRRTVNVYVLD